MPTKVDSYQCDVCSTYFVTKEDASDCEKAHSEYDKLELSEVYYKSDQEFPHALIINNGSGHAGLYIQDIESSVEDVYERFQSIVNTPQQRDY